MYNPIKSLLHPLTRTIEQNHKAQRDHAEALTHARTIVHRLGVSLGIHEPELLEIIALAYREGVQQGKSATVSKLQQKLNESATGLDFTLFD